MSERFRGAWLKIKRLFNRRQLDRDLEDEIAFHLDMRERRLQSLGLNSDSARTGALRRFGNSRKLKGETRDLWLFPRFESLLQDVGYAARRLRKSPGFFAVVVASLALGIAANSTIFSVINAEIFRQLPYKDPNRLMVIWQAERGHPDTEHGPPIAEVVDWNQQTHAFEQIALTSDPEPVALSRLGPPEVLQVQYVTPNFFSVLRVEPRIGRMFQASEAQDQSQTVLISDSFLKRHFPNASKPLEQTFVLGGVESTVVGVMPPGFTAFHGERVDVWLPINPASARYFERKDAGWLMPVGRLRPSISLQNAQDDMRTIARRMERAYPAVDKGMDDLVVPLQKSLSAWARTLYPLSGAVGFVLLIACMNVANLLQSRTEARRKERAVCASLGASRWRLVQQLLVESALLAFSGGVLGLVLTLAGIKVFLVLANGFPNSDGIRIDLPVVIFTAAVSLSTILLFGMAPAWNSSNPDLNTVIRESGRSVAGSRRNVRHYLVTAEVALAMVLLIGAGLMIKSIIRMSHVDLGFDAHHVFTASFALAEGGKYVELIPGGDMQRATPAIQSFYDRLLRQAFAIPGVESAAIRSQSFRGSSFSVLGQAARDEAHRAEAIYGEVSPAFFQTLKIPLKRGRYIMESDTAHSPWVVTVDETLARRYFPGQNPVGQQILMRYESYHVDEPRPRTIVGVVGNAKLRGPDQTMIPTVYSCFRQQAGVFPGGAMMAHLQQNLLLRISPRISGAGSEIASDVQKLSAKLDPDQPVTDLMPVEQQLAKSTEYTLFITRLLEVFAGIALLLAAIGIYGVMSRSVTERTREIGIRMALGAERTDVLGLVTKLGLAITFTGLFLGSLMALALTRVMSRFLFDVSSTDPLTFAAVGMVLVAIALAACYLPARRATRVDPLVALRHE